MQIILPTYTYLFSRLAFSSFSADEPVNDGLNLLRCDTTFLWVMFHDLLSLFPLVFLRAFEPGLSWSLPDLTGVICKRVGHLVVGMLFVLLLSDTSPSCT